MAWSSISTKTSAFSSHVAEARRAEKEGDFLKAAEHFHGAARAARSIRGVNALDYRAMARQCAARAQTLANG